MKTGTIFILQAVWLIGTGLLVLNAVPATQELLKSFFTMKLFGVLSIIEFDALATAVLTYLKYLGEI